MLFSKTLKTTVGFFKKTRRLRICSNKYSVCSNEQNAFVNNNYSFFSAKHIPPENTCFGLRKKPAWLCRNIFLRKHWLLQPLKLVATGVFADTASKLCQRKGIVKEQ